MIYGSRYGSPTPIQNRIVECFQRYIAHDGITVSKAQFQANLAQKLRDEAFLEDLQPLLSASIEYDPVSAATLVHDRLIAELPGSPWKDGSKE